jgi:hypothetical protein
MTFCYTCNPIGGSSNAFGRPTSLGNAPGGLPAWNSIVASLEPRTTILALVSRCFPRILSTPLNKADKAVEPPATIATTTDESPIGERMCEMVTPSSNRTRSGAATAHNRSPGIRQLAIGTSRDVWRIALFYPKRRPARAIGRLDGGSLDWVSRTFPVEKSSLREQHSRAVHEAEARGASGRAAMLAGQTGSGAGSGDASPLK